MTITCENLSFAYTKGSDVLTDVSLSIEPGKVTVVLGPNGSGKSTLLRLLGGLRVPSAGRVTLQGADVHSVSARFRAMRIAYIAQRPSLAFDFQVRRVIELGRFHDSERSSHRVIEQVLDRYALRDIQSRPLGTLSIGQQQRVAFARGAAQLEGRDGGFLLADEPTSALDPKHQLETLSHIRALADQGIGIVLVLHDVSLAARIADVLVLMNASGRVDSVSDRVDPVALERVYGVGFLSQRVGDIQLLAPHAPIDRI